MYLIMLFENFPEAGEIEGLVILQQNEAKIEFTKGKFQVMHFAGVQCPAVLIS